MVGPRVAKLGRIVDRLKVDARPRHEAVLIEGSHVENDF